MEIVFALVLVYTPMLHPVFGTAALSAGQLVLVTPFPFVVWGADEARRMWPRRHVARVHTPESAPGRRQAAAADAGTSGTNVPGIRLPATLPPAADPAHAGEHRREVKRVLGDEQ